MELSIVFHPDIAPRTGDWPSLDQASEWGNLDTYLIGCPYPDLVRECREWAIGVAAGQREIAASAYGYLVRQLKYDDTDKDLTLSLLSGVRAFYQRT